METTGKLFGVASYFTANSFNADDYTEERSHMLSRTAMRTLVVACIALCQASAQYSQCSALLGLQTVRMAWTSIPFGQTGGTVAIALATSKS